VVTLAGIAGLRKAILPSELDLDDREVVARMGRALVTAAERHAPEAQRQMEEIAEDFPKVGSVHYVLGAYMVEMGDPDGGLKVLEKELELDPQHLPALVTVAMEYLKRNEPRKARPYAERAAKLAPGNFAARTAHGRTLLELEQAAAGLKELEAAAKLAPDSPQVHFALASAYSKLGRKEDAARARAEFTRLKKIIDSQAPQ
jgi:predicted Zn-dependent protease